MTHAELISRAEYWLLKTIGCGFVLSDLRSCNHWGEVPDSIGWRFAQSYLVECKTSRADYFNDNRKNFRRDYKRGMGNYRYYMVQPHLIRPDEVKGRWGLLYVYEKQIRIIKQAEFINRRHSCYQEIPLLCSALRRVHLRGDLKKIYKCLNHARNGLTGGEDVSSD